MQLNDNNEHILLVFEGESTEFKIYDFLQRHDLAIDTKSKTVLSTFKAEIYQLYKKIIELDADLFAILRETDERLQKISKDNISAIFLFFDFDCHATNATDEKVLELLALFNNETENGKLFVSYPMVEAFKYFIQCDETQKFVDLNVPRSSVINFKKISHEMSNQSKTWQKMSKSEFQKLIYLHCIKANYIINNSCDFTEEYIDQPSIMNFHLKKDEIYILSAFPLMLKYFHKHDSFLEKIQH